MNVEHPPATARHERAGRTSNVEHRIMYSTIYNKDKATRPPRLSEPTKGRRALSTARDDGQERLPHSTFDVERSMFTRLRRRQRRPGFDVQIVASEITTKPSYQVEIMYTGQEF